jgi:hypothetical protein
VKFEKKKLYNEAAAENDAMPAIFKLYRDRHVKWITGACLVVGALYGVAMVWRTIKVTPSAQGNIAPKGDQEIKERDSEVNPWAGVVVSEMPCTTKSKTTTPDTLEKLVSANLCHMRIEVDDNGNTRTFECDAFFPKSNVALVPQHMWLADDIRAKFIRHDPTKIGGILKPIFIGDIALIYRIQIFLLFGFLMEEIGKISHLTSPHNIFQTMFLLGWFLRNRMGTL